MSISQRLAIAVMTVGLASVARGEDASPANCPKSLPLVLNVGLPFLPEDLSMTSDGFREVARRFFQDLYHTYGRCPEEQLQVNIAFGSEYEILDWLSNGLVDAAIAPELTLYLLAHDGFPVKEVREESLRGLRLGNLLPEYDAGPRACESNLDGRDPEGLLEAFREAVWCEAVTRFPSPSLDDALKARCGNRHNATEPERRIVFSSHLSSTGFLEPVIDTHLWLERRFKAGTENLLKGQFEKSFWAVLFEHADFSLNETSAEVFCTSVDSGRRITVLFPGERTLRHEISNSAPGAAADAPPRHDMRIRSREHLVISARAADRVFVNLPGVTAARFDLPWDMHLQVDQSSSDEQPETAFSSITDPAPLFGVRTFSFTIAEVFRLLRGQQTTSGQADLALVLPGGGVKAAFQARVVEELYSKGHLRNTHAGARVGTPLSVEHVIGTSGGALLGFFVAQIGTRGIAGLPDILFTKDGHHLIQSSDIFGDTDAMRYVSLVSIFLIFCSLLVLCSFFWRLDEEGAHHDGAFSHRWMILLTIGPLVALTPPLLSRANGVHPLEHIPEIEGLLYAGFILLAIFVDQCLIFDTTPQKGVPRSRVFPRGLTIVGVLLALSTLWSDLYPAGLDRPVTTLEGFVVLGGVAAVMVRALSWTFLPADESWAIGGSYFRYRLTGTLVGLLAGAGLIFLNTPAIIGGLVLFATLLILGGYVAGRALGRIKAREHWLVSFFAYLIGSAAILVLCSPRRESPMSWLLAPSGLDIHLRPFLLGTGLLLVYVAIILWLIDIHTKDYHLRNFQKFLWGLGLGIVHLLSVSAVLIIAARVPDGWFPFLPVPALELTGGYWAALIVTSVVMGGIIMAVAHGRLSSRPGRAGRAASGVKEAVAYLGSRHPNARNIPWRFARMALLAVVGVFWWNFLMAPGLYGNRPAREYIQDALERFRVRLADSVTEPTLHPLTTQFVVPTNILKKDGTRFFLFVPGELNASDCPDITRQAASGATWHVHRARVTQEGEAEKCRGVPSRDYIESVIFASGSPFPIFPAHWLAIDGVDEEVVDGGYSNNVPVDAAVTVGARQVLIVHSTNPLGHESSKGILHGVLEKVGELPGRLFQNLGRIPSFLYERAQQVDRLSRRDLFVVSLAPPKQEVDWPVLYDFREEVVGRMLAVAEDSLGRRIGLVESWGRPRFRLSVLVEPSSGSFRPAHARQATR